MTARHCNGKVSTGKHKTIINRHCFVECVVTVGYKCRALAETSPLEPAMAQVSPKLKNLYECKSSCLYRAIIMNLYEVVRFD